MRSVIFFVAFINIWGFLYSSPQINIVKIGKESASLGKFIIYKITIKNDSSIPINNIIIKDKIPPGFKYRERETGKFSLQWSVKTLQGNEQRSFRYSLQAMQEGTFTSTTYLYIAGKKSNEIRFNTVVAKPKIAIDISGPKISCIGKHVRLTLNVKNNGRTNLNDVVIQAANSITSYHQIIDGTGNPTITNDSATWNIGSLATGETKSYSLTVTSKFSGHHCIMMMANSSEGASSQAECCVLWRGYPSLLLEVIDTVDPLTVGEETTYVIEVTNQGRGTQHYVKIVAVFPAEISPISAQGDTMCTINGKRVTVDQFPALSQKEKVQWKIRAKAVQPGDSRLKVYLTSGTLLKPVAEEESTHVYK